MLKKFGKLLKYEFGFYFRIMPLFYAAAAIVSVVSGLSEAASVNGMFAYVAMHNYFPLLMLAVMLIVNLSLIVRRFKENLLGDPGYLMMTLPVTPHGLAASKALAAFCMIGITSLAGLGALFLADIQDRNILLSMNAILSDPEARGRGISVALSGLGFILHTICLIYVVMTASRILPKFRTPAAFIAFFAVGFAENRILEAVISPSGSPEFWLDRTPAYLAVSLGFAALYFWLTGFLLRRTLNLE